MIANFEEKNKDAIVRIGDASYNLGSYSVTKEGESQPVVTEYGEIILSMLKTELNLIKAKISELATELGEETNGVNTYCGNEVEKTIWGM